MLDYVRINKTYALSFGHILNIYLTHCCWTWIYGFCTIGFSTAWGLACLITFHV